MKKRIVSALLCVTMLLSMTACGKEEQQAGNDNAVKTETESTAAAVEEMSEIDFEEDPYTINVCYAVMGEAQPDLAMIEEKLNEVTLKEINANVKLEAVSLYNLANIYALKASSGEKMDLMILFPGYHYLTSFANSNLIRPIDDEMEKWGSDIIASVGDMIEAGQYKGQQYAIPQNRDVRKNGNGFYLNRKLCEKYDIDPSTITSIEKLEEAFALIKENEPEVTVIMPQSAGGTIALGLSDYYDTCGSEGGVVTVEEDGSLKITNYLETDKIMEDYEKVHEWYEKGYISKDILTTQEYGSDAIAAGKCFAIAAGSVSPSDGDEDIVLVHTREDKPLLTTKDDQLILWGVAANSERPDKAVQFINLCYADADVANLLKNGVEDIHYTSLGDGVIQMTDNEGWRNYWTMFGDFNKLYVTDTSLASMGVDNVEDYKKVLDSWELDVSPAYGFNFDPENVKTEIAACDAVNSEYQAVLGNGTVDPSVELPKYIQKLYDSGLQKIMDEKQAQLDAWVAEQK